MNKSIKFIRKIVTIKLKEFIRYNLKIKQKLYLKVGKNEFI